MALTGYRNRCAKNSGGIRRIRLIEAPKIVSAQYDPLAGTYVSLTLSQNAAPVEYEFREDQAIYREKVSMHSGSVKVSHELSFVIDDTGSPAGNAVEQIVEASWDGMVAIVTGNNGESFVVGYSPTFLAERPLRLLDSTALSGTKPADSTSQTVHLYSEDTQKAKSYTGSN